MEATCAHEECLILTWIRSAMDMAAAVVVVVVTEVATATAAAVMGATAQGEWTSPFSCLVFFDFRFFLFLFHLVCVHPRVVHVSFVKVVHVSS